MTFSTPAHEWKFSDIAASDGSVTKTNKSGGALDLKCIPQKLDYPPRTLIVGGPGVGKSSIVIELCKRWYNKDLLHEYKYVILLQGHDPQISNAESIDDFVLPHHREWMIPIIKEDGRNSLFIIDGYEQLDEKCRHHDSFINHFISGKILPEASFVVTTRPWSAKMISEYFSNEVEILGFTPQGRKEFIDHNLGGNADDFCLQKPIERCCAIPFCLATLIEIYQEKRRAPQTSNESQGLPKTLSMLYGELIRTLVLRYVRKNPEYSKFMPDSIDILPGEFLKFPGPIYKKFLELCAFSFNSMKRSGLFVRNARLGMVTFDLFEKHDRNTTSGNKIYYSCLHSSIQEYLAAYCISRMEEKMMKKCISSLKSYSKQYHLILEFLAGFGCTSFVDGSRNIFSNIHDFHIFRQLCEANSDEVIQNAFLHHVNPCIIKRTWPIPSPADFWCLGKVIALSNHEWELGFTLRRLQNTHLKMLCEGINSVDMPSGQIRKFSFSLNNFNEDGLCYMFQINEKCLFKTEEINLSGNHLTSTAIPMLCDSFPKVPNLRMFLFHHNEIQSGEHRKLIMDGLVRCAHLNHVSFSNLKPDECDLLLTNIKCLKVVELWQISPENCKVVFDTLPASRTIEQLEIHQSGLNSDCFKHLHITLPQSKVKTLKMINCGIDSNIVELIVKAARNLTSIDLSENLICDDGGESLLQLNTRYNVALLETEKCNKFSKPMLKKFLSLTKKGTRKDQYRTQQPHSYHSKSISYQNTKKQYSRR